MSFVRVSTPTENAQKVLKVYEILGSGSGGAVAARDFLTEDYVVDEAPSLKWGGLWEGPLAQDKLTATIMAECDIEMQMTIHDASDFVVVLGPVSFVSKKNGKRLDTFVVEHHYLRDGKIARIDVFYKDTHALNELIGWRPAPTDV